MIVILKMQKKSSISLNEQLRVLAFFTSYLKEFFIFLISLEIFWLYLFPKSTKACMCGFFQGTVRANIVKAKRVRMMGFVFIIGRPLLSFLG